jgi:hypothetical protein
MSLPLASEIVTERVDDIPVLLAHLEQMGVPRLLDEHFPTHGNWQGLSLGWTATIWLAWQHQRTLYALMTRCSWETVQAFTQNDNQLQGAAGP